MQELNLSTIKHIFFVGIGGIGISAIARMMFLEGKDVSGSDMSASEITSELSELGIKVTIGQGFDLIPSGTDLIIYTIAIPHYDPKLFDQIKNSGIRMKSYPEMLGIVTANKYTIAVAGTHGKTTTTAMIAKILIDAQKDPSVIVGSILKDYKSNLIVGKSEYFVVEACEYQRSFLNIKPKLLVITNIEADHLDYYKDLDDIKSAFQEFESKSEFVIKDYRAYMDKVPALKVPGEHNRLDAAAALAVVDFLKVDLDVAQQSLANFQGTWRRLEKKGVTKNGAIVYDDYAHHPTEIRASLQGLRELYPEKHIIVLFQPHLYSRTKALFKEFTECWSGADNVFLLPIYFAREDPDPTISSALLAPVIKMHRGEALAFDTFGEAEAWITNMNLGEKDVLVTMGAGEAFKIGDSLLSL